MNQNNSGYPSNQTENVALYKMMEFNSYDRVLKFDISNFFLLLMNDNLFLTLYSRKKIVVERIYKRLSLLSNTHDWSLNDFKLNL